LPLLRSIRALAAAKISASLRIGSSLQGFALLANASIARVAVAMMFFSAQLPKAAANAWQTKL